MSDQIWTISELAKEFSITPRTLRFYEDKGILSPKREGQKRIYRARDRARLKLALRGRRLGFQLAEILSLINMYEGPTDTVAQLERYLKTLERHEDKLKQQRIDLELTLSEIQDQIATCKKLLRQKQKSS